MPRYSRSTSRPRPPRISTTRSGGPSRPPTRSSRMRDVLPLRRERRGSENQRPHPQGPEAAVAHAPQETREARLRHPPPKEIEAAPRRLPPALPPSRARSRQRSCSSPRPERDGRRTAGRGLDPAEVLQGEGVVRAFGALLSRNTTFEHSPPGSPPTFDTPPQKKVIFPPVSSFPSGSSSPLPTSPFPYVPSSSILRTFAANCSMLKGLLRRLVPGSSTPLCTMALRV